MKLYGGGGGGVKEKMLMYYNDFYLKTVFCDL